MSDDIWAHLPTKDSLYLERLASSDSETVDCYIWARTPGRALVGFDKQDGHLAFVIDSKTMTFKFACDHMKKGAEIMKGWQV